jgi:RNA polymerase-interacting CarD/CdnL/TRCF family regulator
MTEIDEMRKNVTKEEVEHTIKVLKEDRENTEAKRAKKQSKKITPKTDSSGAGISVPA